MKTNEELQRDVQNSIKWEPSLNAAEIGVTVKDGIVTLTGTVDSYSKKIEAENATKNVAGVKAVAVEIEINFGHSNQKSDTEIAQEIENSWRWNWEVPSDKIKVMVENGWVNLSGEVQWNYQKDAAKNSAQNLLGVIGVSNNISIKADAGDRIEKIAIENALSRSWSIDDEDIDVQVKGNNVTLTGVVDSIYQKDEAARIAWNAPGVYSVNNELMVDYEEVDDID
jgi:osmotically-inducible protein OsmY